MHLRVCASEKLPEELTLDYAKELGSQIGIVWEEVDFDPEQFLMGLKSEAEHGSQDPETNVTDDDEEATGKIAWAHLKEKPDYYNLLADVNYPSLKGGA